MADSRSNRLTPMDDVPVEDLKFLHEVPMGKIVILNGYEYETARVDIEAQEVILKLRGKAAELASERVDKLGDELDKMRRKAEAHAR